jgi:hypothetical protein
MRRIAWALCGTLFACSGPRTCGSEPTAGFRPDRPGQNEALQTLRAKVARFAPAVITADVSDLPQSERKALALLIEASKLLDPIFDRQAWAKNPQLRQTLAKDDSAIGKLRMELFEIMRGPWDRQDHHAPFAVDHPRPKGAGFYPPGLEAETFRSWIEAHPEDRAALESLFTLVKRDGKGLEAVPYSQAFQRWLEPAADKLRAAADATESVSLARFLRSRADAFLSDDYYDSDKLWMDLDSRVEVTIGPYETYEDKLLGLKASFESFVTVSDPKASARLAKYKELLGAMEANLPVPDEMKTERGRQSPIRVVDLVFSSGDARKSVQTIAFNLPNDERVRKEKGAKKVLLRNLIETKFEKILAPIATKIMVAEQASALRADAFFNQVLFHELSHSLGPAMTRVDGEPKEVRFALGPNYSPIEECKADVMGAYNVLYMIQREEMPKSYEEPFLLSYFAGLFRSVRFGVAEAHGKGAAVQINRYLREGAATFDGERFRVEPDRLKESIRKLTHDLVVLQHRGDADAAEALLSEYGVESAVMTNALSRLGDVPVDIRPVYPLAGEAI